VSYKFIFPVNIISDFQISLQNITPGHCFFKNGDISAIFLLPTPGVYFDDLILHFSTLIEVCPFVSLLYCHSARDRCCIGAIKIPSDDYVRHCAYCRTGIRNFVSDEEEICQPAVELSCSEMAGFHREHIDCHPSPYSVRQPSIAILVCNSRHLHRNNKCYRSPDSSSNGNSDG